MYLAVILKFPGVLVQLVGLSPSVMLHQRRLASKLGYQCDFLTGYKSRVSPTTTFN